MNHNKKRITLCIKSVNLTNIEQRIRPNDDDYDEIAYFTMRWKTRKQV